MKREGRLAAARKAAGDLRAATAAPRGLRGCAGTRGPTGRARGPAGRGASPLPLPGRRDPGMEAWGARRAASPGHLRVSPRPGRGPGSAGGCGHGEALLQAGSGARAGGKLVPPSPGLRGSAHRPPPALRTFRARVASQGLAAPARRRGGGGRLARRRRERPGGRPGLGTPQPPPLAASAASSGAGGRGRKLSDLVGETPKQTAVGNRCPLASALAPPASPRQPWLLATTSGDLSSGGLWRSRARTARRVLPPSPPQPPPPQPPPQLTLPALAAIVTD